MQPAPAPEGFAVLDEPFFTDENLNDSRRIYAKLRDLGDAVWVPEIEQLAVARFDDVVSAARANDTLISSKGVSLNAVLNGMVDDPNAPRQISTILSDADDHRRYRRLELKALGPSAMKQLRDQVETLADDLVARFATGETFDAMEEFTSFLPIDIVGGLVGLKGVDSQRMLQWATVLFDTFGPPHLDSVQASMMETLGFFEFMTQVTSDSVLPDSWAAQLFEAANNGEITPEEAGGLIGDFVIPSLDTTIQATSQLLFQLGSTLGAFDRLREEPDLSTNAVYEAVRLATPLRGFSRYVSADFALSESTLPAGSRAWLVFAAANRDERHYDDPDRFDLDRSARDQVGWGHGAHLCVGKHLAQLEMESILAALLRRVDRIEVEEPVALTNNQVQGFKQLPLRLVPKS
ncbi:MAG: cytochrome P450 [Ilumatobacter sp.]